MATIEPLAQMPEPAPRRIALRVTPQAERALRAGHPWLYDHAIAEQSHEGQPGDLAVVFDRRRRFLAIGLYDPLAPIRVRILQHRSPARIDRAWFTKRLAAAANRRSALATQNTSGYRVVHGSNDGLPALAIDLYNDTLVAKLYTAAWVPHLSTLLAALSEAVPAERVVLRLGREVQAEPRWLFGLHDGMILSGPPLSGPIIFEENGLRFEADPLRGQKTGFFFDQRENRARVRELAAGQQALDVFAYSGGFSVYAAAGSAASVLSIDASRPALEAAQRNFALNGHLPAVAAARHEVLAFDAFEALDRLRGQRRQFGLAMIDPPAFAHKRADVPAALAAYRRLARLGVSVLPPGGTLVMASCTRQVPAEDFFEAVHHGAAQAGRTLREIERTGQPLDHPATFEHAAYLKCLFALAL